MCRPCRSTRGPRRPRCRHRAGSSGSALPSWTGPSAPASCRRLRPEFCLCTTLEISRRHPGGSWHATSPRAPRNTLSSRPAPAFEQTDKSRSCCAKIWEKTVIHLSIDFTQETQDRDLNICPWKLSQTNKLVPSFPTASSLVPGAKMSPQHKQNRSLKEKHFFAVNSVACNLSHESDQTSPRETLSWDFVFWFVAFVLHVSFCFKYLCSTVCWTILTNKQQQESVPPLDGVRWLRPTSASRCQEVKDALFRHPWEKAWRPWCPRAFWWQFPPCRRPMWNWWRCGNPSPFKLKLMERHLWPRHPASHEFSRGKRRICHLDHTHDLVRTARRWIGNSSSLFDDTS